MMKNVLKPIIISANLFICSFTILAQNAPTVSGSGKTETRAAGPEYKTSNFHQWLWGTNYRKEWSTPVTFPIMLLNSELGGLKPVKAGGGNQTKSLQVETNDGKRYTLRTVNKTLGKVLPKNFQNTFIETIVNDKVSMSHPYAAAAVPVLAKSAGLYYTSPKFYYLPEQPALDTFNEVFKNKIYLFEKKIDGDWKDDANLGSFDDYISTDKLLEKIMDDNDNRVDQKGYIKARLFDMFINDWDRHEDQWEWGKEEKNGLNIYKAVPQDRDQAFFNYNGVLLKFLMGASGMKYFQQFKDKLPDVKNFNYEERNLDRFFANQLTLADWQQAATEIQQSITDDVISKALSQLPSEVHQLSGNAIISKLKSRRTHLVEEATTYYNFLAKEVDVVGSKGSDQIEITSPDKNTLVVNLYNITKEKTVERKPFFSRTFTASETKEVRVYGLSGRDVYHVNGDAGNEIKLRLIGGDEKDSITVSGGIKAHVYDNSKNVFDTKNARLHLSNDNSIHEFAYKSYLYNKSGIKPAISFTNEDRLFVGLGYGITTHKWRKEPFASKQSIMVNYSISQKAPRVLYNGLFPKAIGKWDLNLVGDYDAVRWTNFFGLGNESAFAIKDIDYYRTRTEEWMGSAGISRVFGLSTIKLNGFFQRVRVISDTQKFVAKNLNLFEPQVYKGDNFGGAQLQYSLVAVNDSLVPTNGVALFSSATFSKNLNITDRSVSNYNAHLQWYIPLVSKFSLALRAGGTTVTGDPEFYQYASIGGGQTMRAFRRDRFWGKSAFYNSNELRFISKVNSYIFNGKAGLVAFFDNGKVWMPNVKSNVWHTGYGGGIILSPFNTVLADITYGISKDEKLFQLRFSKSF